MKMPSVPEIQRLFALPEDYAADNDWPRVASPKLNGIRAMWVPRIGLFSKDGIPYEPGVLPLIEAALDRCLVMLDIELYHHGMSLQAINSRAGVMRSKPHPEHRLIQAWIIDAPQGLGGHDERMAQIDRDLPAPPDCIQRVPWKVSKCCRTADSIHAAYVTAGYEGTVYKSYSHYRPGRTGFMLKRKGWLDGEYTLVDLIEGEGKHAGTVGAVICATPRGDRFRVGAFEMDDQERLAVWRQSLRPTQVKIRYLGLTDAGVPYHSQVLQFIN